MTPLIFLPIFLPFCWPQVVVKDYGVFDYHEDDFGLIIFVTLENVSELDYNINVQMDHCIHTSENDARSLYLLGGNMGILYSKYIRNATLIYPNMYFMGLSVVCTITVAYQCNDKVNDFKTEINFHTEDYFDTQCNVTSSGSSPLCKTIDLDYSNKCNPVDCMMKYSGERNYFNKITNLCEPVPYCVTSSKTVEIMYQVGSNKCKSMKSTICKADLKKLRENEACSCNCETLVNAICHHGTGLNNSGCQCAADWVTSPDPDSSYEPTLQQYHMCNVEVNAWNSVNKNRIETTILLICIFAITIASKVVILMCVLSWLVKWLTKPFEKPKKFVDDTDQDYICSCDTEKESVVINEALINKVLEDTRSRSIDKKSMSERKSASIISSIKSGPTCACTLEQCVCACPGSATSGSSCLGSTKSSGKTGPSVQVYMMPQMDKKQGESKEVSPFDCEVEEEEMNEEQVEGEEDEEEEEEEEEDEDYEIEFSEEQTEQDDEDHVPLSRIKEEEGE